MASDMDNNCQLVVFSDKAYNAIITETFEWDPVETGGILLGHILDNGCWIVMETLPPGYGESNEGDRVFHEYGYFEYNQKFVNYLVKSVSEQYQIPLELLGLWHRHPGSMDTFSGTDDRTNSTFASLNPYGAISALVNVDPQLRMTMYHLPNDINRNRITGHLNYQCVDVEVGSDLIPEDYFKLRYYTGEENSLHPYAPQRPNARPPKTHFENPEAASQNIYQGMEYKPLNADNNDNEQICRSRHASTDYRYRTLEDQKTDSIIAFLKHFLKRYKTYFILIFALIVFVCSLFSIKSDIVKAFHFFGSDNTKPTIVNSEKENDSGIFKEKSKDEKTDIDDENNKESMNMSEEENTEKKKVTEDDKVTNNTGNKEEKSKLKSK